MKQKKVPLEFCRLSVWQSIFIQARVNGGQPLVDPRPEHAPTQWAFPKNTYLQKRLAILRKAKK